MFSPKHRTTQSVSTINMDLIGKELHHHGSMDGSSIEPYTGDINLNDTPTFWNNVHRMNRDAKLFSEQLSLSLGRVLARVAGNNNANNNNDNKDNETSSRNRQDSASTTTPLSPQAVEAQIREENDIAKSFLNEQMKAANIGVDIRVDSFLTTLKAINQQKQDLHTELDQLYKHTIEMSSVMNTMNEKISRVEEEKKIFATKIKNFLTLAKSTKLEKFETSQKKIQTRKAAIDYQRLHIDYTLRSITHHKQLAVLKPLIGTFNAYYNYFQSGIELIKPLQTQLDELNKYLRDCEVNFQQDSQLYNSAKKHIIGLTGGNQPSSPLSPNSPSGNANNNDLSSPASAGSGIRDLDASFRMNQTKATEKDGYLYIPAPNFHIIFASIKSGKLTITRVEENNKQQVIDLVLCTVKENRDAKLRFVFSLISPMETVLLQAESQSDMNDWMAVIQNAIGLALDNNKSTSTSKSHKRQSTGDNSTSNSSSRSAHPSGLPFSTMCDPMVKGEALVALKCVEGNTICCDCDAKDPDWVSLNLGIVICMECSGVHRAMGVHISKVRSTNLDKLDGYMVQYMCSVGNINSKQLWEAALLTSAQAQKSKPNPSSNRQMREMWIRGKYEYKQFLGQTIEKNVNVLNETMFNAIENGDLMLLLQSLAWGANPTWPNESQENRSALHQAVMYGSPILVECVIQHINNNLNQKELRGWTALHYAAYQDDLALVELLLLRGGSLLALEVDNDGRTPLQAALHHGADQQLQVKHLLEQAQNKKRLA